MSPLVLVVDDEPQIHRFLLPALEAAGYRAISARTGAEALHLAATASPDAILLDLGLPDLDGREVLGRLRPFCGAPVLVLSARDQESEKIAALDGGAEDYVEKPFALGELLARLRVVLRRRDAAPQPAEGPLRCGPVSLDPATRLVLVDGIRVTLSRREFALLALLLRHQGRMMTHRQLLVALWGPAHAEDVQYLRVYVGQLRHKLGPAAAGLIVTEPAMGYRIAATA